MTTVSDVSDFGTLIRQARKEQGLTQTDLAEWCGVGINFVSDVERGKPTVEMGRALRLAQMLGIDVVAQRRGERQWIPSGCTESSTQRPNSSDI